MKRAFAAKVVAFVAALFSFGPASTPASAISGIIYIDQPLPESVRAPVKAFLQRLGFENADAALHATRTVAGGPQTTERLLLRVELREVCLVEGCLTVIGRLDAGAVVPELMFYGGPAYIQGDLKIDLWGAESLPVYFPSGDSMLVLFRSQQGWMIIPTKNGFPDLDDRRPLRPLEKEPADAAVPHEFTWEGFQRALESLK